VTQAAVGKLPLRTPSSNGATSLLATIAAGLAVLVGSCGCAFAFEYAPILDPKGPITMIERDLLFTAVGLMLVVIVPVWVMTFWFAHRYRAEGGKGTYAPNWCHSTVVELFVWLVPFAIITVLGYLLWTYTHRLDPYKPIADADGPPLEVQVVAQNWKWLFIYPEQNIAVVNELVFPAKRQLSLKITSDTVMNAFFVPALAGQIYAMAGMQTRLHMLADEPGRFIGLNTLYSGAGFADQDFDVIATSPEDFEAWVAKVKGSAKVLDAATYRKLAAPSRGDPVIYYSGVEPGLFDRIILKYVPEGFCGPPWLHDRPKKTPAPALETRAAASRT
jgi:cytochrome o ubiquinol oxidase subunit 2